MFGNFPHNQRQKIAKFAPRADLQPYGVQKTAFLVSVEGFLNPNDVEDLETMGLWQSIQGKTNTSPHGPYRKKFGRQT